MVPTALYTGQRLKDIASLTWANVDLQRDEFRFATSKTGRRQVIPIARPLRRHLETLTAGDDRRITTVATLPARERELFFRQYQQRRGVDPVIAEKDFWVCWLLARIFEQPKLADACVFKGGTSLAKVFNAIERFSEDIDLAIIPASLGWSESDLDEAPSRTKRDERMAQLEIACAAAIQNIWKPLLEQAVQAILGRPPDRADWLSYKFDEAGQSPVLLFA